MDHFLGPAVTRPPNNSAARYLSEHPATRAGTIHTPDQSLIKAPERAIAQVAEYTRGLGAVPFRVVRDTTRHPPYGLCLVYTGKDLIGTQLSLPSVEDCQRMLRAFVSEAPAYGHAPMHHADLSVVRRGRAGRSRAMTVKRRPG